MNSLILSLIASTVLPVIGYYIQRNSRTKKIDAAIQEWAPIVFDVVNDMYQQNPKWTSLKSTLFAQELTKILEAKGIKMTPEILTQAKAIAASIHYQDKRAQQQTQTQGQTQIGAYWPFPPPTPVPAQSPMASR